MRDSFIEGDPGALLCVEFYADEAEELPPRLQALEADLRAHGFGYRYSTRSTCRRRRASGGCAKRRSACRWR